MELTYTIERDLKEAAAMAEALVPYVYENELYGKAGSNMPSLTVGALLLRLRRLRALQESMTTQQRGELEQIEASHQAVRKEWRQHYEKKLAWEAESRLKAMDPYFQECREMPQLCANAYLPEALRRTIVNEIMLEMDALSMPLNHLERLAQTTDSHLHNINQPCDFIWDTVLQPVYPQETYWWLYQRPPQPDSDTPAN
ncbi:MAG: hypothetical protein H6672_01525 [Anaerolineaceae bacterium]|nr:hypothetical protein [Anaerolineaceae bacterium]